MTHLGAHYSRRWFRLKLEKSFKVNLWMGDTREAIKCPWHGEAGGGRPREAEQGMVG